MDELKNVVKTENAAEVNPDWTQKLVISYTDLLDDALLGGVFSWGVGIPPKATTMTARCLPQPPMTAITSNPGFRFSPSSGLMSVCESSVVGVATTGAGGDSTLR